MIDICLSNFYYVNMKNNYQITIVSPKGEKLAVAGTCLKCLLDGLAEQLDCKQTGEPQQMPDAETAFSFSCE